MKKRRILLIIMIILFVVVMATIINCVLFPTEESVLCLMLMHVLSMTYCLLAIAILDSQKNGKKEKQKTKKVNAKASN